LISFQFDHPSEIYFPDQDGQPLLGRVAPHVSVVGGFNGHGMPRAFGAARMVVERFVLPDIRSAGQPALQKDERLLRLEDEKMRLWNVERFLSCHRF
jgi:glycine/D-amino acid oxidase-like deaminating enzyme